MSRKQTPARAGRLGTWFRGKLATAYGQRQGYDSNLWYVYSPRMDCDWVLKSDLEWDHFVLAESDPRIKEVDYAPDPVRVRLDDGSVYETTLDAVVTYTDESIEWREIKYAEELDARERMRNARQHEAQTKAAARERVAYTRWTEHELRANVQKLANWRRVIAWLSAARGRSLASYQTDLASYLGARGAATLREIEEQWGEPAFPLYAAALFRAVQHGAYLVDLDTQPLSPLTLVRLARGHI